MNPRPADPGTAVPEIIAIASQKGRVGKSTTALNLSIALVAAGRTLLLMDLDPHGQAGYTLMSGTQAGGTERMLREAALTRDMMTATEIPDLYLMPAGPDLSGIESELALLGDSRTRLHQALATLPALPMRFDHVVIDCPPSMGLLTLNALAAAHKILIPVPCEPQALEGLSALLKTIGRLRAGMKQPLLGVHLLIVRRAPSAAAEGLVGTLRRDYGHLMLLTEIPVDEAVGEAAERGLPLLAHCLHCDVSQAYLEMAAEWLLGHDERQKPRGGWPFRTGRGRMTSDREAMCQRIQAWLMDPSSLLYDETWEARHQREALAFDELSRPRPPRKRSRFLVPLLLILTLSIVFLVYLRTSDTPWRSWANALLADAERPSPAGVPSGAEGDVSVKPESSLPPSLPDPLPQVKVEADRTTAGPLILSGREEVGGEEAEGLQPEQAAKPEQLGESVVQEAAREEGSPPLGGWDARPPINRDVGDDDRSPAGDESDEALMAETLDTPTPATPEMPAIPDMPAQETEALEIQLPPLPGYRWHVQVLAGRSLDRVKADSQHFMRAYAAMLKDLRVVISQSRLGEARDGFYRLRVIGWDSRRAARNWCGRLRARGRRCLVIRVIPDGG